MKLHALGAALLLAVAVPASAQSIAQRVAALEQIVETHGVRFEQQNDQILNLRARVDAQARTIEDLQAKLACMSMVGDNVFFTGCNVNIVNGMGSTATKNALGNLIVGYNEPRSDGFRTGSHNLVVGPHHDWTSYGGFVAGRFNIIGGEYATVSGGADNFASGRGSSVSGGIDNQAGGDFSSVSGGTANNARGGVSSVSGGSANLASGGHSSVTGGSFNIANAGRSSVSGGRNNQALGDESSVSGGRDNRAQGVHSSISGGNQNQAQGVRSSVSGGFLNQAQGESSSVSGGNARSALNQNNWAAGSLLESQ